MLVNRADKLLLTGQIGISDGRLVSYNVQGSANHRDVAKFVARISPEYAWQSVPVQLAFDLERRLVMKQQALKLVVQQQRRSSRLREV